MYIIQKGGVNVTGKELTKAALVKRDDKSIRGECACGRIWQGRSRSGPYMIGWIIPDEKVDHSRP